MEARMERIFARRRPSRHRRLKKRVRPALNPQRTLLSYWLKLADKHVSRKLNRELKAYGLIYSEWQALRELYQRPRMPLSSLAAAIGMSKGGASKLVARLMKKKLVRKKVCDEDRRNRLIGLRMPGESVTSCLDHLEHVATYECYRKLGRRRHAQLLKTLEWVVLPPIEGFIAQPPPTMSPTQPAKAPETAPATSCDPMQVILNLSAGYG
jgi:DNA-binding MarR family transcriptional regulator